MNRSCPSCGGEWDDKVEAFAGETAVCLRCGEALVFTPELELRVLRRDELAAMPTDVQFSLRLFQRTVWDDLASGRQGRRR